jgi:hypothetical protein
MRDIRPIFSAFVAHLVQATKAETPGDSHLHSRRETARESEPQCARTMLAHLARKVIIVRNAR